MLPNQATLPSTQFWSISSVPSQNEDLSSTTESRKSFINVFTIKAKTSEPFLGTYWTFAEKIEIKKSNILALFVSA